MSNPDIDMIRTSITKQEFEKLTWLSFDAITTTMDDIEVTLKSQTEVVISVLGEELKTMMVEEYNAVLNISSNHKSNGKA